MNTKITVAAGSVARCNRCNCKGHLDRNVEGQRENDRAVRLLGMAIIEECGHLDSHWVYDADQK